MRKEGKKKGKVEGGRGGGNSPSVSAASITPSANVKPRTDVPVTVGCLDTKNHEVGRRHGECVLIKKNLNEVILYL